MSPGRTRIEGDPGFKTPLHPPHHGKVKGLRTTWRSEGLLSVSTERFDFDVRIWDIQLSEQLQGSHDHAGRAGDIVDRIRKIARGFREKFLIDPSGPALPSFAVVAGEGVEDAEAGVLLLERIEFESIYDLVLAPVAMDEPDRDGQRLVGRIFGHAFERRDPDASRQEDRGPRFVEHEVTDRAEDGDLVARPQGREGALVGGVREADRVFEVRARGARGQRHGARVHPLLGLQLKEGELGGTEAEGLRFLQLDRMGARCERPRHYNSGSEAARGACHSWTSIDRSPEYDGRIS